MNLRWLWGNFTDPQYNIPRREQFRLSNEAHKKYLPASDFWWYTALIGAPFIAAFALIEPVLGWIGYPRHTGASLIAHALVVFAFWPWSAWMYRSLYVRPVRMAMRNAGYDLCLGCGYELRGLDGAIERCPECGETRPDPLVNDSATQAGEN